MPENYNAGTATISLEFDLTAARTASVEISSGFAAAGKDSGKKFTESLKNHFASKDIASAFSKNIIEHFEPRETGSKLGKSLGASLSSALKSVLLKGGIGLALDGIAVAAQFAWKAVTKGAREARQETEKFNQKLAELDASSKRTIEVLKKYNAVTHDNADLLGIVSGEVDSATGKLRTLYDILEELKTAEIKIEIENIETRIRDTKNDIDSKLNEINSRPTIREIHSLSGLTEVPHTQNIEKNEKAQKDIVRLNNRLRDNELKLEEANKTLSRYTDGVREYFEVQKEIYDLNLALSIAQRTGNKKQIQDLEDQIKKHQLVADLIKFGKATDREDANIKAIGILKGLRDAEKIGERNATAQAKYNREIDEARRLREESLSPIQRYRAEVEKLNAIKADPERFEIIGGDSGLEQILIDNLTDLASRTKDFAVADAELSRQIAAGNIEADKRKTILESLADVSGRTAELDQARSFKQRAATPLEAAKAELQAINEYEASIVSDPEKYAAYGGSSTGERFRVQAISGLLADSGDAEAAIALLVAEFEAGRVGVENFGAAFKDLTENSEEFRLAGDALTKLGELRDVGVINSDAYNAAANAIKQAKDYTEDLTEAEKRHIEKLQEKVALEIQGLEIKKARALADGEHDVVAKLEEEIDLLRRKNNLIGLGIPEQEAETLAADIAKNEEIAAFQGQIKTAMSGAFRAAMSGNFDDFLRNKLQNAAANMFDRALDSLLDTLFSALENINFGGGEGGGLGGLAGLFAGFFADGGTIQRGQFGIVGEAGPELAYAGSAPVSIVPFKPSRLGGRITGELDGGARVSNSSVVMNIQTPDVQGFRKARAVIEGDMAVAQRRAQRDI